MKKTRRFLSVSLIIGMLFALVPALTVAAEDSSGPSQSFLDRMNAVYEQLTSSERTVVGTARNNVENIVALSQDDEVYLFQEIWAKIEAAVDASSTPLAYDLLTQENLLEVFSELGVAYFPDGSTLDGIPEAVEPTLNQLADLAGVSVDVTWADIEDYLNALEAATKDQIANKSFETLVDLLNNNSGLIEFARDANDAVLSDNSNANAVKQLLVNLGINSNDIKASANRVMGKVDPTKEASKTLMLGYIRTQAKLIEDTNVPNSYNIVFPELNGLTVGASLFSWLSDNSDITVAADPLESGKVIISQVDEPANPANTTAVITGALNLSGNPLNGRVFIKQTVELGARSILSEEFGAYEPGDTVDIEYKLQGVTGKSIDGATFMINFDANKFELAGVGQTPQEKVVASVTQSATVPASSIDINAGGDTVSYLVTNTSGTNPIVDGTLFTLHLVVKNNAAAGTATFTAEANTMTNGEEIYSVAASSLDVTIVNDGGTVTGDPMILSIGTGLARPDRIEGASKIKIPVIIDATTYATDFTEYSLDIRFDPSKAEPIGIVAYTADNKNGVAVPTSLGAVTEINPTNATVNVQFDGAKAAAAYATSKGILFFVEFQVQPGFVSTDVKTDLQVKSAEFTLASGFSNNATFEDGLIYFGMYGDVNGDGNIASFDINQILRYSLGKSNSIDTTVKLLAADINQDGVLASFDINQILRYTLGKSSNLQTVFGY